MSGKTPNYYEVLGVSQNASFREIKEKYRDLLKEYHPDYYIALRRQFEKDGDERLLKLLEREIARAEEATKLIIEAYEVLSNPLKRKRYDKSFPRIVITPAGLDFELEQNSKAEASFVIENKGGLHREPLGMDWENQPNWAKLRYQKTPKVLFPIKVTVEVDTTNLDIGKKSERILISVNGKVYSVEVTLKVIVSSHKTSPAPSPTGRSAVVTLRRLFGPLWMLARGFPRRAKILILLLVVIVGSMLVFNSVNTNDNIEEQAVYQEETATQFQQITKEDIPTQTESLPSTATSTPMPKGPFLLLRHYAGTLFSSFSLLDLDSGKIIWVIEDADYDYSWEYSALNHSLVSTDGIDISVFDVFTGELVRKWKGEDERRVVADIEAIAVSPDGETVISAGSLLRSWNIDSGRLLWEKEMGVNPEIVDLVFTPDGGKIISVGPSWDPYSKGKIAVWDANTGEEIRRLSDGYYVDYGYGGNILATTPDGEKVIAINDYGEVEIWDITTGDLTSTFRETSGGRYNVGLFLSPDGNILATEIGVAGRDAWYTLWDVSVSEKLYTFGAVESSLSISNPGQDTRYCGLVFSDDSKKVLIADEFSIRVHNLETKALVRLYSVSYPCILLYINEKW